MSIGFFDGGAHRADVATAAGARAVAGIGVGHICDRVDNVLRLDRATRQQANHYHPGDAKSTQRLRGDVVDVLGGQRERTLND